MQLIIRVCLPFFSFLMDYKIIAPLTVDGAQHSVKYGGSLVSELPLQRGRKVCESLGDQRPRICIIEGKGSAGAWCDGMELYSIREPESTGPSPARWPLDLSHCPSSLGGGQTPAILTFLALALFLPMRPAVPGFGGSLVIMLTVLAAT